MKLRTNKTDIITAIAIIIIGTAAAFMMRDISDRAWRFVIQTFIFLPVLIRYIINSIKRNKT